MALFTAAALKSLIPSLVGLAAGIVPFFGPKKTNGSTTPTPDFPSTQAISTLQTQIAELQAAVTTQGQALCELSKELEQSFNAIAASIESQEKQLKHNQIISFCAIGASIISVVLILIIKMA